MITAFKVVLLVVIIVGLIGAIGEKDDQRLQANMTALCIAAIFGFILATLLL